MAFFALPGRLLLLGDLDLGDIDLQSAAQLKNDGNGRVDLSGLDRFQQIYRITGLVRKLLQAQASSLAQVPDLLPETLLFALLRRDNPSVGKAVHHRP